MLRYPIIDPYLDGVSKDNKLPFCPYLFTHSWASDQAVSPLDCCAKHRWLELNPQIIVGKLAHCLPSSTWVPGGNIGEVKGGEERNWPPYLTMPAAQDKCHLWQAFPSYGIVYGTHLYLTHLLIYSLYFLAYLLTHVHIHICHS